MSTTAHPTTTASVTEAARTQRIEHAQLATDPGADSLFQLLVAARRTLEQVQVLVAHYGDPVTGEHVSRALEEISLGMDRRVMVHR